MSPGDLGHFLPKISSKKRLCGRLSGNSSTGRGEQPWESLTEDQSCCISRLGRGWRAQGLQPAPPISPGKGQKCHEGQEQAVQCWEQPGSVWLFHSKFILFDVLAWETPSASEK